MIREGSTSRETIAESKALLEVLNVGVLSVGASREIITAHDEVIQTVDSTILIWIVVIGSVTRRASRNICGDRVAHVSRTHVSAR